MRERTIFRNYFGPENAGCRAPALEPTSPHDSPVMAVAQLGARSIKKPRGPGRSQAGAANAKMTIMRTSVGLSALVVALSGLAYACGADSLSAFDASEPSRGEGTSGGLQDAGGLSAAPGAADLGVVDNAVILVHAAKSQAFRLCFGNEDDRRPQPDSALLPEANVVGVEVGGAVRLPPLRGVPGDVILYDEPTIRASYPTFGGAGAGPSCKELGLGPLGANAQLLGNIGTDLSTGVHLLVVTGCPSDSLARKFSVAECGAGWLPGLPAAGGKGNLGVKDIPLLGAARPANGILPAQIVNLSQPLESARAGQGKDLVITFGALSEPSTAHVSVATNPLLFGDPQPYKPAPLAYDSQTTRVYGSVGFRVMLSTPAKGDAATDTKVLDESLADIQRSSSPREIPPSYYAAASNYALLLLGDPGAKLPDGGPDTDDRRALHLLAIPVVEPKVDGGADSGSSPDLDGGAAPPP